MTHLGKEPAFQLGIKQAHSGWQWNAWCRNALLKHDPFGVHGSVLQNGVDMRPEAECGPQAGGPVCIQPVEAH
jgi:hypothetical protein